MLDNNYFDHINKQGETPFDRMEKEGVKYISAGENIASGQFNAIYAHEALMNSKGHRKNILRKTMLAAEKVDLPLENNALIDPHADYYLDNITNYDYSRMIELVGDMRKRGLGKKERLEFINKALLDK